MKSFDSSQDHDIAIDEEEARRDPRRMPRRFATGTAPSASSVPAQFASAVPEFGSAVNAGIHAVQPVQFRGGAGVTEDPEHAHRTAARGVSGAGSSLPHMDAIQKSFGKHDVSGVRAHVGGAATEAAGELGAVGYASGDAVAFAATPDLHLAAHEAAHTVQQRGGVRLSDGLGQSGDEFEKHADEVADAVVQGRSAETLLDRYAHRGSAGGPAIQKQDGPRHGRRGRRGASGARGHGGGDRGTPTAVAPTAVAPAARTPGPETADYSLAVARMQSVVTQHAGEYHCGTPEGILNRVSGRIASIVAGRHPGATGIESETMQSALSGVVYRFALSARVVRTLRGQLGDSVIREGTTESVTGTTGSVTTGDEHVTSGSTTDSGSVTGGLAVGPEEARPEGSITLGRESTDGHEDHRTDGTEDGHSATTTTTTTGPVEITEHEYDLMVAFTLDITVDTEGEWTLNNMIAGATQGPLHHEVEVAIGTQRDTMHDETPAHAPPPPPAPAHHRAPHAPPPPSRPTRARSE